MTKAEIGSLALKFAAIYVLIQLLTTFSVFGFGALDMLYRWYFADQPLLYDFGAGGRAYLAIIGVLALGVPIVTAFLLWKISNRLVEVGEPSGTVTRLDGMAAIMLGGIGIWVVITSLPDLFSGMGTFLSLFRYDENGAERFIDGSTIAWFIGVLLEFFLGLSLIIGRRRWEKLLFRLRYSTTK